MSSVSTKSTNSASPKRWSPNRSSSSVLASRLRFCVDEFCSGSEDRGVLRRLFLEPELEAGPDRLGAAGGIVKSPTRKFRLTRGFPDMAGEGEVDTVGNLGAQASRRFVGVALRAAGRLRDPKCW